MDQYSRRLEVLVRIAELLEQMPEDVLLQLIQSWEAELNGWIIIEPRVLTCAEPESSTSNNRENTVQTD